MQKEREVGERQGGIRFLACLKFFRSAKTKRLHRKTFITMQPLVSV